MQIFTFNALRKLEESLFSDTLNDIEKLEALEKLSDYYEFLKSSRKLTHHFLSDSYTRIIDDFKYHSDIVSEPIADGITKLVPFRIDDLESLMSSRLAQFYIQDMVCNNILEQCLFVQDSSTSLKSVIRKLNTSCSPNDKITLVRFLDVLLDSAICEYDEELREGNDSSSIIQSVIEFSVANNTTQVLDWARKNEDRILTTRAGSVFGLNNEMQLAFKLHEHKLTKLGAVVARCAVRRCKDDDLLIREKIYGQKLNAYEINTIASAYSCSVTPCVIYMLYANDLEFDFKKIKAEYGLENISEAIALGKDIKPGRLLEVLAHILENPRTTEDFSKIMTSWIDVDQNLPEGFRDALFFKAYERFSTDIFKALSICLNADTRGIIISDQVHTAEKDIDLAKFIAIASEKSLKSMIGSPNFLNAYSREAIIESFKKRIEILKTSQIEILSEVAPQWIFNEIGALKKAKLSRDMGL